jgi:hypothetical protein
MKYILLKYFSWVISLSSKLYAQFLPSANFCCKGHGYQCTPYSIISPPPHFIPPINMAHTMGHNSSPGLEAIASQQNMLLLQKKE